MIYFKLCRYGQADKSEITISFDTIDEMKAHIVSEYKKITGFTVKPENIRIGKVYSFDSSYQQGIDWGHAHCVQISLERYKNDAYRQLIGLCYDDTEALTGAIECIYTLRSATDSSFDVDNIEFPQLNKRLNELDTVLQNTTDKNRKKDIIGEMLKIDALMDMATDDLNTYSTPGITINKELYAKNGTPAEYKIRIWLKFYEETDDIGEYDIKTDFRYEVLSDNLHHKFITG